MSTVVVPETAQTYTDYLARISVLRQEICVMHEEILQHQQQVETLARVIEHNAQEINSLVSYINKNANVYLELAEANAEEKPAE